MYQEVVNFIREVYQTEEFIPLHAPVFIGNEKRYVHEVLATSVVSSIGEYVHQFEIKFSKEIGSNYAIATTTGTAALHVALLVSGVERNTEVMTQPLTFVATCNAISYCGGIPHFVDVDRDTLGLSADSLSARLKKIAIVKDGICYNKNTGRRISACVPMHTFGHPCRIDEIAEICKEYNIPLVEDAAEGLGSRYKEKHLGTYGKIAAFSFNGNKIITSGGGGVIVTDDKELAQKAKHLTTTAKLSSQYEYIHDEIGYNYRMPNLNAALLVGQLENLSVFLENKRSLAQKYADFFKGTEFQFLEEPSEAVSNYWLNAILIDSEKKRNEFLRFTNENNVMTRPVWQLMCRLKMFKNCPKGELPNAEYLEKRIVNIPSSVVV
jgi:perosamine synthetase